MAINVTHDADVLLGGLVAEKAGLGRFKQAQDQFLEGRKQFGQQLGERQRQFDIGQSERQRQFDTNALLKQRQLGQQSRQFYDGLKAREDEAANSRAAAAGTRQNEFLRKLIEQEDKAARLKEIARGEEINDQSDELNAIIKQSMNEYGRMELTEDGHKEKEAFNREIVRIQGDPGLRPKQRMKLLTEVAARMAQANIAQHQVSETTLEQLNGQLVGRGPEGTFIPATKHYPATHIRKGDEVFAIPKAKEEMSLADIEASPGTEITRNAAGDVQSIKYWNGSKIEEYVPKAVQHRRNMEEKQLGIQNKKLEEQRSVTKANLNEMYQWVREIPPEEEQDPEGKQYALLANYQKIYDSLYNEMWGDDPQAATDVAEAAPVSLPQTEGDEMPGPAMGGPGGLGVALEEEGLLPPQDAPPVGEQEPAPAPEDPEDVSAKDKVFHRTIRLR